MELIKFLLSILVLYIISSLLYLSPIVSNHTKAVDIPITAKDAQEVYRNLNIYTGFTYAGRIPLRIVENTEVNAYTDGKEVVLYSGMLNYVESKDELAAVLAHEVAHAVLEHVYTKMMFEQSVLEGNADKFAIYLMLRAGYDVCQAKNLWINLRNDGGDYEYNSDHPNYSYRIWQFDFPQCS